MKFHDTKSGINSQYPRKIQKTTNTFDEKRVDRKLGEKFPFYMRKLSKAKMNLSNFNCNVYVHMLQRYIN